MCIGGAIIVVITLLLLPFICLKPQYNWPGRDFRSHLTDVDTVSEGACDCCSMMASEPEPSLLAQRLPLTPAARHQEMAPFANTAVPAGGSPPSITPWPTSFWRVVVLQLSCKWAGQGPTGTSRTTEPPLGQGSYRELEVVLPNSMNPLELLPSFLS